MKRFMMQYGLVVFLAMITSGCIPAMVAGGTAAGYYVGQDERSLNEIVDDASISTGIKARFLKDKTVSAWDIDVDTRHGVVTIHGTVASLKIEDRAIEIIKGVHGVKKIVSRLTIVEK